MGRAEIARGLLAAAEAMDPEVLETKIRGRISEATTTVIMTIQDQVGINHCYRCPARIGLKRQGQDLVCPQHHDARDGG